MKREGWLVPHCPRLARDGSVLRLLDAFLGLAPSSGPGHRQLRPGAAVTAIDDKLIEFLTTETVASPHPLRQWLAAAATVGTRKEGRRRKAAMSMRTKRARQSWENRWDNPGFPKF